MKLSIAIPTSEMKDGKKFFRRCLDSLWNQSFQDFEIVVTDNSDNDEIERICEWYKTGIRYSRNPIKGMAQNTNEAIKQSKGELIKILYMDDFMAHDNALQNIVDNFKGEWLVTACTHVKDFDNYDKRFNTHIPTYEKDLHMINGINTIGSPSVLTIKREGHLLFDENMTWLLDCDLYKRYHEKYGSPVFLDSDINVVIGLHSGQATNIMGNDRKNWEHGYIKQKYE